MIEQFESHKNYLVLGDEPFVEAKAASARFMMLPELPLMLRKAGRIAGVYALSYLAVKALDNAAATHPDNKLVNGADQIANVVFGFENLAVGGAIMIAEAGYEAATKPKLEPKEPLVTMQPLPLKLRPHPSAHKHHRNRAPLNAKLAPDGLTPAGRHESSAEIILNGHMNSDARGFCKKSPTFACSDSLISLDV